jgi:5,10-methylenetetrahydromethanopterin reductase
MDISCTFPPGPDVCEHVVLAERLGYRRAWIYDSPPLYPDVWVTLARLAERTSRIGLGPAVLVPSLRHVLTQASAIATLEQLAPGRVAVAIGVGFTARFALGQRPLRWPSVETYIRQLRGLLRGETVSVDGAAVRMLHPAGYAPQFPINVPIVVAANHVKGLRVAREVGDGVMCFPRAQPGFPWCALIVLGTVLDEGEPADSPRAFASAGPALTVGYHNIYESRGAAAVDRFPGGAAWRRVIEEIPAETRHLALHELHLVGISERDRPLLRGDLLKSLTWTGTSAELRERLDRAVGEGVTEIVYGPMGPDVPREVTAFARMAGL